MKIAITTSGINLDAPIDSRFGRAPKMLIYDSDLGTYHVQSNEQNMKTAQGAGIQTALHLCDEKVGCVITGNCGPKAFETLKAAHIAVCTCTACTVNDAIEKFKHGELVSIDEANAAGHWVW
ncbi:NifB/NifX family molybdenum-iron cluster-binding protein [Pontiellaceae bacterium B12227]|nr:NifB/NifX family molybdenum-iron cluster-binding protein [Pontiellaceae bacterium B12227]